MNEIVLRPASMPMPTDLAQEFSLSQNDWRVLVDQLYPSAKSSEAIAMAMSYCRARNLDIFKRPVHIVPMWSSALNKMVETVWPGIAEIRTTAARTGEYAGIDAVEFGPLIDRTFHGEKDKWENKRKVGTEKFSKTVRFPEWASVVVYRWVKGEKAAFHAKIYWEETYASIGKSEVPNDMWARRARGQLDKCVEAAALRKAFPEELGNTYAAEEMEGRTIDGAVVDHEPTRQSAPSAHKPPVPPRHAATDADQRGGASRGDDIVDAEVIGEETGEVLDETPADDADLDDNAFFTKLDEDMAVAGDAATLEEIWDAAGPMERFENQPNGEINQGICTAIKNKHLKRVEASNGKG